MEEFSFGYVNKTSALENGSETSVLVGLLFFWFAWQ